MTDDFDRVPWCKNDTTGEVCYLEIPKSGTGSMDMEASKRGYTHFDVVGFSEEVGAFIRIKGNRERFLEDIRKVELRFIGDVKPLATRRELTRWNEEQKRWEFFDQEIRRWDWIGRLFDGRDQRREKRRFLGRLIRFVAGLTRRIARK